MAEWNARPRCDTLTEHVTTLPDDSEAVFTFDGSIFSIRYDEKVNAFAAAEIPWAVSFKVRVGNLRRLPKRLMHDLAGISIWESRISIGNRTYPEILDGFDAPDPSKIQ